ncbi:hypothetical protein ABZX40_26760 [Streptomyces sp. NPDC004610]|uniref:hypothetical protein n=1 Tax=unclassified Streptomyces TaxID=2593676 RepID=UPI0033A29B09
MASDELNGLFLVLTGQRMPDADPELMRAYLVAPQRELEARIAEVQALLVRVAQSVAGGSNGAFSEAYYEAMLTLAQPEGRAVLAGLGDAARELGDAMEESAYQVEYVNLMIVFQLGMFLVEFAATFVMAVFNPVQALMRQAFLRNAYGRILTSLKFRVLLAIAEQQVLQGGLAVAMDRLAQWTLAGQGKHTGQGDTYLTQAAAFGAVAGFVSVPVQFGASWLAQNLMKRTARDAGEGLFEELDRALSGRQGGPAGKDAGDAPEGGPVVKPVPRPRPGQGSDGFTGKTLITTGNGRGGGGGDRAFARGLSGQVSAVVDGLSRGGDPGAVGRSFIDGMGDVFARRFGDDMGGDGLARELGEDWAGIFLRHLDRDGLGDALRSVLLDGRLPVAGLGDDVVRVMSQRVEHWFGPRGWVGEFTEFALHGIGDGVTGVGSEVFYNTITQQKVSVSGGGFLTSMTSERFADGFNMGADWLAAKFKPFGLNLGTALNLNTEPKADGLGPLSTTGTVPAPPPPAAQAPAADPVNTGGGSAHGSIDTGPPLITGTGTGPFNAPAMDGVLKGFDPSGPSVFPATTPTPLSVPTVDVPGYGVPVFGPPPVNGLPSPYPAPVASGEGVYRLPDGIPPHGKPDSSPAGPGDVPVPTAENRDASGQPERDAPPPVVTMPVPDNASTATPRPEAIGTPRPGTDRPMAGDARTPHPGAGESQPSADRPRSGHVAEPRHGQGNRASTEAQGSPARTMGDGRGTDGPTSGIVRRTIGTSIAEGLFGLLSPGTDTPTATGGPGTDFRRPAPGGNSSGTDDDTTGTAAFAEQRGDLGSTPLSPVFPADTDPEPGRHSGPDSGPDSGPAATSTRHSGHSGSSGHSATTESGVLTDADFLHPGAVPTSSSPGESRLRAAVDAAADTARRQHGTEQAGITDTDTDTDTDISSGAGSPHAPTPLHVINCVVLLKHLIDHLHPRANPSALGDTDRAPGGSGPSATGSARTVDDLGTGRDSTGRARELGLPDDPGLLAGTTNAEQFLAPGPGWTTVSSPTAVRDALLNPATEPGSTGLILIQHDTRPGHAFAAHRTETGVRWVEMQTETPDGPLISDDQPAHWPVRTRAVVLGPDGRTIPDALDDGTGDLTDRRPSDLEALLDPPRDRTYGRGTKAPSLPRLPDSLMPSKALREAILLYITQDQLKDVLGVSKSSVVAWANPTGPKITAKRVHWVSVFALIMRLHGLHTFDADGPERTWYDQVTSHRPVRDYMEELLPRAYEHIVVLPPRSLRRGLASGVSSSTLDSLVQVARTTVSRWESGRQDPGNSNQATYAAVLTLVMDFFGLDTYNADSPERAWYNTTLHNPDVQRSRTERLDHVVTRLTELGLGPERQDGDDPPPEPEPTGGGHDPEPISLSHPWAPAETDPEPSGPPGTVPPPSPMTGHAPAPADSAPRAAGLRAAHTSDEDVWSYLNLDMIYGEPSGQSALPLPTTSDERGILRNVNKDQLAAVFGVTKTVLRSWGKPRGPAKGRVLYVTALALAMEAHGRHTYAADSPERTWYDDITARPPIHDVMDALRPRARRHVVILPPQPRRQGLVQGVPSRALDRLIGLDNDTVSYWHRGIWNPHEAHQAPYAAILTLVMDFLGLHRYTEAVDRDWYDLVTSNLAVRRFRTGRRDDVFARLTELGFLRGRHYDSAAPADGGHDLGLVRLHAIASTAAAEESVAPAPSGTDDTTALASPALVPDTTADFDSAFSPGSSPVFPVPSPLLNATSLLVSDLPYDTMSFSQPGHFFDITALPEPGPPFDITSLPEPGLPFDITALPFDIASLPQPDPPFDITTLAEPDLPFDITALPQPGFPPDSVFLTGTTPPFDTAFLPQPSLPSDTVFPPDTTLAPDPFAVWDDGGGLEYADPEPLFLPDTPLSTALPDTPPSFRLADEAGLDRAEDAAETAETAGVRSPLDGTDSPGTMRQLLSRAGRRLGRDLVDVAPGGNCFFDALIQAGRDVPESIPPSMRRDDIRHYLADDLDEDMDNFGNDSAWASFRHLIVDDPTDEDGQSPPRLDPYTRFVHVIRTPGLWNSQAGDFAPQLAARAFNLRIHVLSVSPDSLAQAQPVVTTTYGTAGARQIWLAHVPGHWLALPPSATNPAPGTARDTADQAVPPTVPVPATKEQRSRLREPILRNVFAVLADTTHNSIKQWEAGSVISEKKAVNYTAALAVVAEHHALTIPPEDAEFLQRALAHDDVRRRMKKIRQDVLAVLVPPPLPADHKQRVRLRGALNQEDFARLGGFLAKGLPLWETLGNPTGTRAVRYSAALAAAARYKLGTDESGVDESERELRNKDMQFLLQAVAHDKVSRRMGEIGDELQKQLREREQRGETPSGQEHDSPVAPPAPSPRPVAAEPSRGRKRPRSDTAPAPRRSKRIRTAAQSTAHVTPAPPSARGASPLFTPRPSSPDSPLSTPRPSLPSSSPPDSPPPPPAKKRRARTARRQPASPPPPVPPTYAQRSRLRGRTNATALRQIIGVSGGVIQDWESTSSPKGKNAVAYTAVLALIAEQQLPTEQHEEDAEFLRLARAHPEVSAHMEKIRTKIVSLLQRLPLPTTYEQRIRLRRGLARSTLEKILKISDGSMNRWETKGDPSIEATVSYTAALAVITVYAMETGRVRLNDEDADFLSRAYAHNDVSNTMGTLRTPIRQALDVFWARPARRRHATPSDTTSDDQDLAEDTFRTLTRDA